MDAWRTALNVPTVPDQDHPYRSICDLRSGAAASLIELEFASHTGEEGDCNPRVPAGLPYYSLRAQLRELELTFLNRFLQVGYGTALRHRCQRWVTVLALVSCRDSLRCLIRTSSRSSWLP